MRQLKTSESQRNYASLKRDSLNQDSASYLPKSKTKDHRESRFNDDKRKGSRSLLSLKQDPLMKLQTYARMKQRQTDLDSVLR